MTKRSHNKKRNVGIIYEQLVQTISRALVEDDKSTAMKAKNLIKRFFKPGTELYKEHRLFNALAVTRIQEGSLATRILSEAKSASRDHSKSQLDREKSRLIREINRTFGQGFYGTRIKDYVDYANIQILLNEWRNYGSADIKTLTLTESKVHDMLLRKETEEVLEEEVNPEIDNLVVRIMTEKFNKKFGNTLTPQQKVLIKEYVFSQGGKSEAFVATLDSIRTKTISELKAYKSECDNQVLSRKIDPVIRSLNEVNVREINDTTMAKFLTLCGLQNELKGDE